MNPTPAPEQGPSRLLALDGLRLAAALMVVAHHWIAQGSDAWQAKTPLLFAGLHPYAAYGWMGVQLFFLISGFVICMSSWGRSLGEFFASRVSRLYPAYWFAVLATTLVVRQLPLVNKPQTWAQVLVNLTMLEDPMHVPYTDEVYWTLSVELRFYVLFALGVVWRGVTYRRGVLFCVLWTLASLVTQAGAEPTLHWVLIPEHSAYFIAGVAIYLMHRFRPTGLLWAIVAVSWVRAQSGLVAKVEEMSHYTARTLEWSTAVGLMSLFFLVVLAAALGWLRWARWRGLTTLGALTYPLYLMHMVIGWTLIRRYHAELPRWGLLLGLLGAMLGLAWLVQRFVERPLSGWLKRSLIRSIADARQGLAPPAAAPTEVVPLPPPAPPVQAASGE